MCKVGLILPKNKITIYLSENPIFDFDSDFFGGKRNQIVVFIERMQTNVIFVILGIKTT